MNKIVSIFIITRKRIESLERLLRSLTTAYNINNLEVWIGYDYDDEQTIEFLKTSQLSKDLNISPFEFKGEGSATCSTCNEKYMNRHKDMLQPMAEKSSGRYLWILNDDVEIRTPNFDIMLDQYIEAFLEDRPDRLVYVKTGEVFRHPKRGARGRYLAKCDYACYPLITREVFNTLGFFLPTQFPTGGADITLAKIFNRSLANRSLSIPDIICYDHIDALVVEEGRTPHGSVADYSAYEMNKDILKIDALVQDSLEKEAVDLHAIRVQLVVSCKSCHNEILVPTELSTNMVVCHNCNARNVIAGAHLELSYNLCSTEESITNAALGLDESDTVVKRKSHE